jgi:hypothetical protein
VEAGIRFRAVVWAAIVVFACGLCYSMGFQSGWMQASGSVEVRMTSINETLRRIMDETHPPPDLPTDLPSDALQAAGPDSPLPAG